MITKPKKNSQLFKTYGAIDELNSFLGIIKVAFSEGQIIEDIQTSLFEISALLAGDKVEFDNQIIQEMAEDTDHIEKSLPKIGRFIYSGGTELTAAMSYARTLARKAEREVVELKETQEVDGQIPVFFDVLSRFLFALTRLETLKNKLPEKIWKPIRKFTPFPVEVSVNGLQGYKQEDFSKWLKDNEIDSTDFFKQGVKVVLSDNQIIILKSDVDALVATLK